MAAATETTIGVLDSGDASSQSTGSGSGTGAGSGTGSGLGQGSGGGTGGGVYRPGSGIINPAVVREVKPQYTADAMRAKVQGTVLLECVVLPDGSVGRVDVVKSLDSTFGLDQEAVKAAPAMAFSARHAVRRTSRRARHDRAHFHPSIANRVRLSGRHAEVRLNPDGHSAAIFCGDGRDAEIPDFHKRTGRCPGCHGQVAERCLVRHCARALSRCSSSARRRA